MLRLFHDHNFQDQLKRCEVILFRDEQLEPGTSSAHPDTVSVKGRKYRVRKRTLAVIFYYTHLDRSITESIRMLLINGVKHEAVQLSPI